VTAHGRLSLPAFLPDATRAAVRAVEPRDLVEVGVPGLVVSTYHLRSSPGVTVVSGAGGIHSFMRWDRPVFSDSGGFQVFSLMHADGMKGTVSDRGFTARPDRAAGKQVLTPEKSMLSQFRLGADAVVCLDHCTHPEAPCAQQRASVDHTVAWAHAAHRTFQELAERTGRRPLLFAVVQGGTDPALRRECAGRLLEIGFDGYGFGGWPVADGGALVEAVQMVAELIPPPAPLWGLGIGKPPHIAAAARMGYGLFDCVLPTRDGRHGRLYVSEAASGDRAASRAPGAYGHVYILDRKHVRSADPVDPECRCPCCRTYTRAYLHHLFRVEDPLALRLATVHNLAFYVGLVDRLRTRSAAGDARGPASFP
jgi:queuine tRNA-ribosyltransferase